MLLAVDIGNTRIKGAVFEQDTMRDTFVFLRHELEEKLSQILNQYPECSDLIIASVGGIEKDVFLSFAARVKIHFISHEDRFPFHNDYATPTTLGIDRMVLASGAVLQFPREARLVIDAGTCVTYDFINAEDHYLGGAISPGIRLRYEALNNYTASLPLLKRELPEAYIGNSTAQSIHSGVVNGIVHEIDGFIDQYRSHYPKFIIILTGGDAVFFG